MKLRFMIRGGYHGWYTEKWVCSECGEESKYERGLREDCTCNNKTHLNNTVSVWKEKGERVMVDYKYSNEKGVYTIEAQEMICKHVNKQIVKTKRDTCKKMIIDFTNGDVKFVTKKGAVNKYTKNRMDYFLRTSGNLTNIAKKEEDRWLNIFFEYFLNVYRNYFDPKDLNISLAEKLSKIGEDSDTIACIVKNIMWKNITPLEGNKIWDNIGLTKQEWNFYLKNTTIVGLTQFCKMNRESRQTLISCKTTQMITLLVSATYTFEKVQFLLNNGYSLERVIQYAEEDVVAQGILEYSEAITLLRDTVKMCKDMKVKMYEKYPKSLKKCHDIALMHYNKMKSKIQQEKFAEAVGKEGYTKYMWKNSTYSVVLPKSPEDLIREGQTMGHCVASYVDRVAKEETKIFFLRKLEDEEKPLVTIEVWKGEIVQVKAKYNERPNNKELVAIAQWADKNNIECSLPYVNTFREKVA